jgi:hypothetical protein
MADFAPKQAKAPPRKRARRAPAERPSGAAPVGMPAIPGGNALASLTEAIASAEHAGSPLPHLDRIEAAFGPFEVRNARAVIGGRAGAAADQIGARAFTVGDRVAFRHDPDLFLAAHEAAHLVQQQRGVDLAGGDLYEHHADAVANAVVDGKSAVRLLAAMPSGSAHETLQRDTAGYTYDPVGETVTGTSQSTSIDLDEQAELDQVLGWRAKGTMPVTLDPAEPTYLVVPADASYEEIAVGIGVGVSAGRTDWFEIIPPGHATKAPDPDHKLVRVRDPGLLSLSLAASVRAELDRRMSSDVRFVVANLNSFAWGVHWAAVERVLEWGDRADWRGAGGRSYFDLLLDQLEATQLTMGWGGLESVVAQAGSSRNTKSALQWLLAMADGGDLMLRRMIEMRSTHTLPNAEHMFKGPDLAPGSPLGYAFTGGKGATIVVVDKLIVETSMDRALVQARNSPYLGLRVIVPASSTEYIVYSARLVLAVRSESEILLGEQRFDTNLAIERYMFHFPGTAVVYPDSYSSTQPVGTAKTTELRQQLLFETLTAAQTDPKAILGLDLDVLAGADAASRNEIVRILFDKGLDEPGGAELLARVIMSTPSADFSALERKLTTSATIMRILNKGSDKGPAIVGRAYTMKALELRPLGAGSLDSLPEYNVGSEGSDKFWVELKVQQVASQAVAPADWNPQDPTTIGHEPAIPGQPPGATTQTEIRFRQIKSHTPWYGFGAGTDISDFSPALHPTQLVRIRLVGTSDVMIASAFELAMIGPIPDSHAWREVGVGWLKVLNLWMMYFGARSFIGGMSTAAMMTRGLQGAELEVAETAAGKLASATIRKFIFDVVVLGGSTAINEYRDDLMKTPAGRAFVTLADIALLGLAARDVYKLFSSGVLTRLITSAGKAIAEMGAAAPQRLLEAYDAWRAFSSTFSDWLKRGLTKLAKTDAGFAFQVPVNEADFLTAFRTARAELAGQRVLSGLQTAGRATDTAKDVLGRLGELAKDNEELAKAYSAVARRAARLEPSEVNLFLKRVAAVLDARKALQGRVGGFLSYAMRADDALAALAQAERLAGNTSISDEALAVLAKKAGAGKVDIGWLNDLDLDPKAIDFMGRDPKCPWDLFKRAAENPLDLKLQDLAQKAIRGYAGEMLAGESLAKLLPRFGIVGRQVRMGSSILDFQVRAPGRMGVTPGLEVKAWRPSVWDDIASAILKRVSSHKAMTADEAMVIDWFDGLVDQLKNAKSAQRAEPYLMMSNAVTKRTREIIKRYLWGKNLDPELLLFDQSALDQMIHNLSTGLSVPPP